MQYHDARAPARLDGWEALVWRAAVPAYREPFRRGHDERHLAHMLTEAQSRGIALDSAQILAIAFHDYVYLPAAPKGVNEMLSAMAMRAHAGVSFLQPDEQTLAKAAAIIEATVHDPDAAVDASAATVLDLDLAGLAWPYPRFVQLARDMAWEFRSVVPEEERFMRLRAGFLTAFARRERIFRTAPFADDETAARENIRRFAGEFGETKTD